MNMNDAVRYQVMPPLSAEEYQEHLEYIDQRAQYPGFKRISDEEVKWFFDSIGDPLIARSAVVNTMWRESHPDWRKPNCTGFIYFIEAKSAGLVKIGFSGNPKSRVDAIQGMSPVPVRMVGTTPGRPEDERSLHRKFADLRVHGEWFRMEERLSDYIEEVCGARAGFVR